MFVGYGIAGYPVKVVLEQDIADELNNKEDSGYIYTIDSKTEFEELLVSVFNSKTMQKIIQNLITASNRKLLEQKEAKEDCQYHILVLYMGRWLNGDNGAEIRDG